MNKLLSKKEKVKRLDYLFLQFSSILSIFFIFFQALIGGNKAIILFFPLFVFIFLIPLYFGYIRGAILFNSNIDRIRGWIYLCVGSIFYILLIIVLSIRDFFTSETFQDLSLKVTGFSLIFIGFQAFFVFSFINKLMKLYNIKTESLENKYLILIRSSFGSMALGLAFSIAIFIIYIEKNPLIVAAYFIFLIIPLVFVFLIFELKNNHYIQNPRQKIKKIEHPVIFSIIFILAINCIFNIVNYLIKLDEIGLKILEIATYGPILPFLIFIFISYIRFKPSLKIKK